MDRTILRGDVYYANLDPVVGSEQGGLRPVIIISNNVGNKFSTTVIIAAMTGKTESKRKLPVHCYLKAEYGLGTPTLVLLEQLRTIDKRRLEEYVGTLNENEMREVDKALAISLNMNHI